MKKIFFAISIFAITIISCDNNSSKNVDNHTHDDGTVHDNHTHSSEEMPEQEYFEVEKDSLLTKKDSLNNDHKAEHSHGGHTHTH